MDKSNASMITSLNGEIIAKLRSANHDVIPIGVTPRLLHCWNQSNVKQKRSFVVGNPDVIKSSAFMSGSLYLASPANAVTGEDYIIWIVTGYTGEKISVPTYYFQTDTGLDDGTASQ
jgi:hypothetical protein